MNRELTTLYHALEPLGLDAAALLRQIAASPALLAQPTRLELNLAGGVTCCVSRCGLDENGRRQFLSPYELAEDEVLDLHYLTVAGQVYTFADLWQGPWEAPHPAAAQRPAA